MHLYTQYCIVHIYFYFPVSLLVRDSKQSKQSQLAATTGILTIRSFQQKMSSWHVLSKNYCCNINTYYLLDATHSLYTFYNLLYVLQIINSNKIMDSNYLSSE